jgi:hypothetical protein
LIKKLSVVHLFDLVVRVSPFEAVTLSRINGFCVDLEQLSTVVISVIPTDLLLSKNYPKDEITMRRCFLYKPQSTFSAPTIGVSFRQGFSSCKRARTKTMRFCPEFCTKHYSPLTPKALLTMLWGWVFFLLDFLALWTATTS